METALLKELFFFTLEETKNDYCSSTWGGMSSICRSQRNKISEISVLLKFSRHALWYTTSLLSGNSGNLQIILNYDVHLIVTFHFLTLIVIITMIISRLYVSSYQIRPGKIFANYHMVQLKIKVQPLKNTSYLVTGAL